MKLNTKNPYNNLATENEKYGSRKFYANLFADIFADIGEEFHDPDNMFLGMYDAAFEWLQYHENCSNKYKLFIQTLKEKTNESK